MSKKNLFDRIHADRIRVESTVSAAGNRRKKF